MSGRRVNPVSRNQFLKKWACVISIEEVEIDQAIEEPTEILHTNQDSESYYEKSDKHETFELNLNFQMLPKELYEENYEAINVALRLVKKTEGRINTK
ncbi:UNVERIFIED_CONTAM: hypothetical protein NCL1_64009 [Trichonephila clavipes]